MSNQNVAVTPLRGELFAGLHAIVHRASLPSAQTSATGDTDNGAIYNLAKDKLLALSEFIAPFEEKAERDLMDRDRAIEYFDVLGSCLGHQDTAQRAFEELGQIAVLCQSAINFGERPPELVPDVLLQQHDDDSQLVDELRSIVRLLVEARDELHRQARRDQILQR